MSKLIQCDCCGKVMNVSDQAIQTSYGNVTLFRIINVDLEEYREKQVCLDCFNKLRDMLNFRENKNGPF